MSGTGSHLLESLRKFREQQRTAPTRVANAKPKQKAAPKPKPGPAADEKPHWSKLTPAAPVVTQSEGPRHVPQAVGLKIKRLLDCLHKEDKWMTPEQLSEQTDIPLTQDTALLEFFKENPKVAYEGGQFRYQALHKIANKQELLSFIDKNPEGTIIAEIKDSYKNLVDDIKEYAAAERVWVLQNSDTNEDIVYPNDPRLRIKIDNDIQDLWNGIKMVETETELLQELHKVGLKECLRQQAPHLQRNQPQDKGKGKERVRKLRNVHNAHVLGIFKEDEIQQPQAKKAKR